MISRKSSEEKAEKVCVHKFGYKYSEAECKQTFFSQTFKVEREEPEELVETFSVYCKLLEHKLASIRDVLVRLLKSRQTNKEKMYTKSIEELMEDLLLMVLQKGQENDELRQRNEILREELDQYLMSEISQHSDVIQDSRIDKDTTVVEPPAMVSLSKRNTFNRNLQDVQLYRNSEESTKTRSIYKPQVLFQIGKEVKTINEISSGKILSLASQINAISKDNTPQLSSKQLPNMKKTSERLSIDWSLKNQALKSKANRINIYSSKYSPQPIQAIKVQQHLVKEYLSSDSLLKMIQKDNQAINLSKVPKEKFLQQCEKTLF